MSAKYVPRVLIVDDIRDTVEDFTDMLRGMAECVPAYSADEARARITSSNFDLILLDYDLGQGNTGLDILKFLADRRLDTPVIIISVHVDYQLVKEVLFAGAVDFLGKTPDRSELRSVVERGLAKGLEARASRALKSDVNKLFAAKRTWLATGISPAIVAVNNEVMTIAPAEIQVLITGESGTGKERIARAIHEYSLRKAGPFVAVNCAGLDANWADSELFGHVKGAFTGADSLRKGAFEKAHGGTLFLDEIGDMDVDVQMKLLRVLEQKEFKRLGGDDLMKTDVRVICATNVDMEKGVAAGKFRLDLFQRVKAATIHIPPLRQRREDIPGLVAELLADIRVELKKNTLTITNEALRALQANDWIGNTRELGNLLLNAAYHCPDGRLDVQHVAPARGIAVNPSRYKDAKNEILEQFQFEYWKSLWAYCGGNKSEMARVSGVSRQGIRKILERYAIEVTPVSSETI
ncbi:MAG: sigma-54-dependent Fis family transcriptional regulator [bacterium]|nr:sigma-54-dependent Fis family transcriptional regulator [bacterium]